MFVAPVSPPVSPDVILGGVGIDTIHYDDRTVGVVVNLGAAGATDGQSGEGDTVGPDVENVWGTQANDILIGSPAANFLDGGTGNDYLFGVDGDDRLLGGIGDDNLYGANGADAPEGDVGSDLCDVGTDGLTRVNCER